MFKCPYANDANPCDVKIKLEVSRYAEEEALETFHEMQSELNLYLRYIELLKAKLLEHGIDIPELEDTD